MKRQVTTIAVRPQRQQPQPPLRTQRQKPQLNWIVNPQQQLFGQRTQLVPRQKRQNNPNGILMGPRNLLRNPASEQVGAVVRTRLTKLGMSDIRSHRITWVAGYTYVGNGTNGTNNSVYYQTASSTYLIQGFSTGSKISGQVPILAGDPDIGQAYVADVEKHYARKVIRRMFIHVDSLQPSTSNNMMAVIGVSRGAGGAAESLPQALATAAVGSNTVANVSSMRDAFTVDSWEHRTVEITQFIAGGSGPKQNEFEIGAGPGNGVSFYSPGANAYPNLDVEGTCPACIAVAGNSTTAGLEGTQVHQISITQEVDLLDYIGGMAQNRAEA